MSFRLKIPISLFLIPLSGLFLSLSSIAQTVDSLFLLSAIQKLEHAKVYTLTVADAMPAERYTFQPTTESMTFARQLVHLAENLGWLSSSYLNNDSNPILKSELSITEKEAVIDVLNRAYDYAIAALHTFPPHHLTDTVSFFAGPMSKLQIINLMNDHQTHHRGQLAVYLRLVGIKPPAYSGW
jgi:uncharacterized damage-inducible protein DinB